MNRIIKFRVWDAISKKLIQWNKIKNIPIIDFNLEHYTLEQSTGFKDIKGKEIYEGDILSDWTLTDKGKVQSKQQVFWHKKMGVWSLDNSRSQDKSSSFMLYRELSDFNYEIYGNIHEKI